jgi:hypothetical protein
MLPAPFRPDLILDVDESGFSQRLLKRTQKNCAFLRTMDINPGFLEVYDANHVTLVGAVTLSGRCLVPHPLSARMTFPSEIVTSYLASEFRDFRASKGYLTAEALDCWIEIVLMPYAAAVQARVESHFPEFLLLDGLRAHFTPHARDVFARESVIVMPISAHTSRLYQVRGLCVFGIIKQEYGSWKKSLGWKPPPKPHCIYFVMSMLLLENDQEIMGSGQRRRVMCFL